MFSPFLSFFLGKDSTFFPIHPRRERTENTRDTTLRWNVFLLAFFPSVQRELPALFLSSFLVTFLVSLPLAMDVPISLSLALKTGKRIGIRIPRSQNRREALSGNLPQGQFVKFYVLSLSLARHTCMRMSGWISVFTGSRHRDSYRRRRAMSTDRQFLSLPLPCLYSARQTETTLEVYRHLHYLSV